MARMKRIIFAAILTVTVLNACQNPEEENTATTPDTASAPAASNPIPDSQNLVSPTPTQPIVPPPPPTPVLENTPPPVPIAGASPKVNPAHGLPGHRCDLQVGAPLPQAGSVSATQVVPAAPSGQAGPTVQSIVAPPPPNTGSPISGSKKVNPAHGQPGHRCDIAVGAPLN